MYRRDRINFLVNCPIYSKWWWWCLHVYVSDKFVVCVSVKVSCASFAHLNADEQIENQKRNLRVIQYSRLLWDHIRKETHTHTHTLHVFRLTLRLLTISVDCVKVELNLAKKLNFQKNSHRFHANFFPFRFVSYTSLMFFLGIRISVTCCLTGMYDIFSIFKWKVVLMIIHKILNFCWLCVIVTNASHQRNDTDRKTSKKREQNVLLHNINRKQSS